MSIYGTTILSICLLAEMLSGKFLAIVIGIDGNIGGVGLAMLLLIAVVSYLHKTDRLKAPSATGITFWSSIYVPIVVAMAASQDVARAIGSGALAIIAGLASVVVSFALFPLVKTLTDSEEY